MANSIPDGFEEVQTQSSSVPEGFEEVSPSSSSSYGLKDFAKDTAGTLAAAGDIVSGIPKAIAQAALMSAAKISHPEYNTNELWDASGKVIDDRVPTIGHATGLDQTGGYKDPMYPFEKLGEGVNWAAEQIPNKDVAGVVKAGANFVDLPLIHPLAKAIGKGIEKIDPALRDVPKSSFEKNLDANDSSIPDGFEVVSKPPLIEQLDLPMQSSVEQIAAQRTANGAQIDMFDGTPQESLDVPPIQPQVDVARQQAAQAVIEARQKALEQEVARQTSLDQNAAQRQRFENAEPAGLDGARQIEELKQRVAEMEESHRLHYALNDSNPEQLPLVEDYGNHNPMDHMPNMRIDENGIPIRADLSMEAQHLQDPLQRNLWGDELPPKSEQEGIPLTQAIDSMPWAQRRGAIRSQLSHDVEASPELNEAVAEANQPTPYTFSGRGPSPLAKAGRGKQGGWVNPQGFKEGFQRVRDLANGLRLVFKGTEDGPHIQAIRNGQVVGELKAGSTNWLNPEQGNLESNWVHSSEPGVAREMYRFARDMGNDIVPAKTQTAAGKAMWDRFEKNGLSQNGKIEGVRGGNYNKQGGSSQILTDLANGAIKSFKATVDATRALIKGVSDFASGLGKPINAIFDLPKTAREAIDGIHPALKKGLQDVIPKPAKFEELKQVIMSEKDGPSLWKSMQSGGASTAQKVRSTLIQGVYHWNKYAQKVADYSIRTLVRPTELLFHKLSSDELYHTAVVLRREMFDGKLHTPEQLRASGMSERAIQAYTALRKNFNQALDKLNQGRAAIGKDPIQPKEAYLASRWTGDWHVPIYDKEGKLVWYLRDTTKGKANAALDYLKSHPELSKDLDLAKAEVTYRASSFDPNSPRNVMAAYKEFVDMLDKDDPRTQALKEAMEAHMQHDAYDFMNTKKHFLEKVNARGFVGDQPWKNPKQQAKDMMVQQFSYLKDAHRWSETQQVIGEIKKFLSDPELQKAQPNNMVYAHQYVMNSLGAGTSRIASAAESQVAKMLGISRSSLYKFTNDIKSMFYLQTLGGSIGFMLSSPLQMVYGIAYHRLLSTEGIAHNVGKTTIKALLDTTTGLLNHGFGELLGKDTKIPMTGVGKEALRYAIDNGIITHDIFDEVHAMGTNPIVKGIRQTLGVTMTIPEKIGRASAFMSFVHHLDQSGKYPNRADLFQKAEDLTNVVMNDFSRSERPMIFNKLGALGEQIVPLKSFIFGYYNQLNGLARLASKGTVTPLLAFLSVQFFLGGINNIPGINEMDGLLQMGKNLLAHSQYSVDAYDKLSQVRGIKEAVASDMPNWAAYGPLSDLMGVNMASRASTSIINTENPLGDMFPLTLDAKEALSNTKFVLHPTQENIAQAAWTAATPWMKGEMETHWDVFKTKNLKTGEPLKDSQGRQLYQRASALDSHMTTVARTPEQEFKRSLGLRDLGEQRQQDLLYRARENAKNEKAARDSAMDRYFDALVHKDTGGMQKYAQMYGQDFNGADTFARDLERRIRDYTTTDATREYLRRASLANVQQMSQFSRELKGNQ